MNKKKLNKTVWYSSELDENKNPILPPIADSPTDLNGLHEGEIFLHNSDEDPSIWIRTSSGKIQRLKGTGENVSFWELMTDENGNKYIFTKYHLVTQLGLTMYSGEDGLNLPSIYDGLPIDSQTIYWEDIKDGNGVVIGKILKTKTGGGTLGSLTNVGEWADSVADVDRIMVQKKGSDTWEAMDVSGIGSASFENISESGEGNAYTSFELSEDKKFLTLVKGETFALASDLENKWTTDEELINNWNTAFGWGNHAEAGYALQTSLDLVSEKLNNFLEGSDTDSIINKWKELEVFLGGLTESDNLAEILATKANQSALEETNRTLATKWTKDDTKIANWDAAFSWGDHSKAGYAAKSYVDSTFVTIAGNEDVTGVHNFVNGLKIGGKLIDKPQDDVIYIDANLVVRGGITMYGDRDANIPSILNSIPTAGYDDIQARGLIAFNSKHFVINNGVVSAIQGSAGLNEEQLGNYLKNNHYATEDWVKEYIVEINTGETVNITKQMVIDALEYTPYDASNPNGYITSATLYGYLPLTGGTLTGDSDTPLVLLGATDTWIAYRDSNNTFLASIGVKSDKEPYIYHNSVSHKLWHEGNDGGGSGLDADKLDGREGSGYTYHINGVTSVANKYIKIATLPASSGSTYDNVTISGTIGGWFSYDKADLKITVGRRDGVTFKGYSYPRVGWDIYVNDNGELLIYLPSQYYAWDLSVTCNQAVLDYKVDYTPTDTNFTKMSDSRYIVWFNNDGSVASATKLNDNTSYTAWGQTFFTNGKPKSVSGDLSGVGRIIRTEPTAVDMDFAGNFIFKNLNSASANYWHIDTADGNPIFVVHNNGNIGIGTISPSSKLHVYGNVKAENGNFIGNLTGTASNAEKFAGVDFATFVSIIPTNTNQLDNGAGFITSSDFSSLGVITTFNIGSQNVNYATSAGNANTLDGVGLSAIMKRGTDNSYDDQLGNCIIKYSGNVPTIPNSVRYGAILQWSSVDIRKPSEGFMHDTWYYQLWGDTSSSNLYYRRRTNGGDWTTPVAIANIDSNVASATKLSDNTSFTIWGQTFFENGKPKNVSGDLSGVGNVISSGAFIGRNSSKANESYFGNASSGVNGDGALMYAYGGRNLYFYTNGVERIRVTSSGNVGIGTTSPAYPLDVNGTVRASDYRFKRGTDGADTMSLYSPSNTTTFALENRAGAGSILFSLNVGGIGNKEVGKFNGGDGTFEVKGNALIGGGITMYSQLSLKDVVDERGLSLSELSTIKPTRYTWKDGRDNKIHIGGIADDIQQVLPEVVYKTEEGVLTMDYGNAGFAIAASLIKPVVDHEQRIKALEKENELLKQELNRLRA